MFKYISTCLLSCALITGTLAQPGFSLAPLRFKVFYNGEDFIRRTEKDIVLEWHSSTTNHWQKAMVQNGEFITGAVDAKRNPADIKIYRRGSLDTMFIRTSQSLHHIPFQSGQFVFDHNTAPLANMKAFSATHIINQHWKYFSISAKDTLPLLQKQRYVYMDKDLYPHDFEEPNEPGVQYKGFQKSEHIQATDEDEYELYMELGQLYYAPALSSSVYCIGYVNDLHKEIKDYRPWLLESKDGCRSWSIRFALQEADAQLVNIKEQYSLPMMLLEIPLIHPQQNRPVTLYRIFFHPVTQILSCLLCKGWNLPVLIWLPNLHHIFFTGGLPMTVFILFQLKDYLITQMKLTVQVKMATKKNC